MKQLRQSSLLSHALLQQGMDLAPGEKALRDVLMIDRDDQEARSNLTVLLRQQRGS